MTPHQCVSMPLLIFLVVATSVAIDSGIIPHFSAIADTFAIEPSRILRLITVFNFGFILSLLCGSLLTAMWRTSTILIGIGFACTLSVLFVVSSTSFQSATIGYLCLGVCAGLSSHITWEIALSSALDDRLRSKILSAQLAARPIGIALGVPAFSTVMLWSNWRIALICLCGFNIIVTTALSRVTSISKQTKVEIQPKLKGLFEGYKALGYMSVLGLLLGQFLTGVAYLGVYSIIGLWFNHWFNSSANVVSWIVGLMGVIEGASSYLSHCLFKRFEHRRIVVSAAMWTSLSFGVFIFCRNNIAIAIFGLLAFVVGIRQLIFASFDAIPRLLPPSIPHDSIGSFLVIAAWAGFSVSSYFAENVLRECGIEVIAWLLLSSELLCLAVLGFVLLQPFENGRDVG